MRNDSNLAKALPLLTMAALFVMAGFAAGCGKDTENANASPVSVELSAASTATADEATLLGNPADLVEELAARVELSGDQRSALMTAVADLKAAMAERRGQGPRQGPPSAAEERPFRAFLIASGQVLDPAQTAAWLGLLAEKHAERWEQSPDRPGPRREGFGPRGGGHRGAGHQGPPSGDFERPEPGERLDEHLELLAALLELNETQVTNLRNALTALVEQWRTTREGLERGSQELREAARQHHEAMRAAIGAELTEEQRAVFDAMQELMPRPRGPRRG